MALSMTEGIAMRLMDCGGERMFVCGRVTDVLINEFLPII